MRPPRTLTTVSRTETEPEWILRKPDESAVEAIVERLDCHPVLARALVNRGIEDPETARRFLEPTLADCHDPADLPDVKPALRRLARALHGDERVVIHGDRDVDGVAGTAILREVFRSGGLSVHTTIPGKWDGYGLDVETIEELAAMDTDLLVTVDCGTTAVGPIDRADELGIDVIVTDHHEPEPPPPEPLALINPRRADADYPNPSLAGAGVAYKLAQVFGDGVGLEPETVADSGLALAGLATMADYVPLTVENRALARAGFERLQGGDRPGLTAAMDRQGVETIRDVTWSLVPLLNGSKEDPDGDLLLELFATRDRDRAEAILDRFEDFRAERKAERAEQLAHLEACLDGALGGQLDADAPVIWVEVERYVGGVPLSRVAERYGRPVVALRHDDGVVKASARGAGSVDLVGAFARHGERLETFWGHPGAAGFRVRRDRLEVVRRAITDEIAERYDPAELRPTVEIDAAVEPAAVDADLVTGLQALYPCGTDNPEPTVLVSGLEVERLERFGSEDEHVRLVPAADDAVGAVHWGGAGAVSALTPPVVLDLVGTLVLDDWGGSPDPMVSVEDWQVAEDPT